MKIQSQAKFYVALLLLTSPLFANVVHLASEEQYEEILKDGKPTIVRFAAEWCGACQSVKQAYADLAGEVKDVTFVEVNVDKFQPLAQKNNVAGIPTFLYLHNGSIKHQEVGVKNPATFKEDVKHNISTQFGSAADKTSSEAPAATGHEMGIFAKLQALFVSAFHAIKNVFVEIFNKIKGLFGK